MNWFSHIRLSSGQYLIRKKLKNIRADKEVHNFRTAKKAAIVFSCNNTEEFGSVREFRELLHGKGIETSNLGYVNDKKIPEYLLMRPGFNFFCRQDLRWNYIPRTPFIDSFLNTKFDVLFDLSLRDHFPLEYIVRLSTASYKIGRYTGTSYHDLMIDVAENPALSYLIGQIIRYMDMIRCRTEK